MNKPAPSNKAARCAVAMALLATAAAAAQVHPESFARTAVATLSGNPAGSPLHNFPVPLRISAAGIPGFDYADCAADGSDLRFADAAGELVPHEIAVWNRQGESVVWVLVPTLSGTGTTLRLYYGAGALDLPPVAPSAVWTASGYAAVWHLDEAGDSLADSTGHRLTGVNHGTSPAGTAIIGGARLISDASRGTKDEHGIEIPSYDELGIGGTFSFSLWMKHAPERGQNDRIASRKSSWNSGSGWELELSPDNGTQFAVRGADGGKDLRNSLDDVSLGTWQHLAVIYSGAHATVYVNGASRADTDLGAAPTDNGRALVLGNSHYRNDSSFKGVFDEVRLHSAALSADWVAAECASADAAFASWSASSAVDDGTARLVLRGVSAIAPASATIHGVLRDAVSATSLELLYGTVDEGLARSISLPIPASDGPFTAPLGGLLPGTGFTAALRVTGGASDVTTAPFSFATAPDVYSGPLAGSPGLYQAKWGENNNRTYPIATSSSATLVSGPIMADWRSDEGNRPTFADPVYGGEHKWNYQNTTFGYAGFIWLQEGTTYAFAKNLDDGLLLLIDGATVIDNGTWDAFATATYACRRTGWHSLEIRCWDGTGGKGPCSQAGWDSTLGFGWRADGQTAATPQSGWSSLRDTGDGMLLRTSTNALRTVTVESFQFGPGNSLSATLAVEGEADTGRFAALWAHAYGGTNLAEWTSIDLGTAAVPAAAFSVSGLALPAAAHYVRFAVFDSSGSNPVFSQTLSPDYSAQPAFGAATTAEPTDGDRATLASVLLSDGGSSATARAFCRPADDASSTPIAGLAISAMPGVVSCGISGLTPGVTYVGWIVAENAAGATATSPTVTFTTRAGTVLATQVSSAHSGTTASFSGEVAKLGAGTTTVRLLLSKDGGEYAEAGSASISAEGPFSLSAAVQWGCRYDFRFVSENTFGTGVEALAWSSASGTGTLAVDDGSDYVWNTAVSTGVWHAASNWAGGNAPCAGFPTLGSSALYPAGSSTTTRLDRAATIRELRIGLPAGNVTLSSDQSAAPVRLSAATMSFPYEGTYDTGFSLDLDHASLWIDGDIDFKDRSRIRLLGGSALHASALRVKRSHSLLSVAGRSSVDLTFLDLAGTDGGLVVDDSSVDISSGLYFYAADGAGGTIRFRGAAPSLGVKVRIGWANDSLTSSDIPPSIVFEVPAGGWDSAAIHQIPGSTDNGRDFMGGNTASSRVSISVDPASPARKALGRSTALLIDWPNGVILTDRVDLVPVHGVTYRYEPADGIAKTQLWADFDGANATILLIR